LNLAVVLIEIGLFITAMFFQTASAIIHRDNTIETAGKRVQEGVKTSVAHFQLHLSIYSNQIAVLSGSSQEKIAHGIHGSTFIANTILASSGFGVNVNMKKQSEDRGSINWRSFFQIRGIVFEKVAAGGEGAEQSAASNPDDDENSIAMESEKLINWKRIRHVNQLSGIGNKSSTGGWFVSEGEAEASQAFCVKGKSSIDLYIKCTHTQESVNVFDFR
ncbi:hypothetical protein ACJX0J_026805, partial [Zea mays]